MADEFHNISTFKIHFARLVQLCAMCSCTCHVFSDLGIMKAFFYNQGRITIINRIFNFNGNFRATTVFHIK
jgi:hypothetical protein